MFEFAKIMSKRTWFLLFNIGTIIYLISSGTLTWDAISIFSCVIALLLMNGIAWISGCEYPHWK